MSYFYLIQWVKSFILFGVHSWMIMLNGYSGIESQLYFNCPSRALRLTTIMFKFLLNSIIFQSRLLLEPHVHF